MKKSLVALAVLGTLAGTASAQSSVTLFGVLDANVRYVKTGGVSLNQVATDGQQTSRVGLRGTEDLGGGLKANFFLDSQLQSDTGIAGDTTVAGKFWNRRATVGLSGDFGEFRIGRDKTSVRNLIDDADAFGTVGLGAVTSVAANALGSGSLNNNRSDNQVRYFLPSNLGGIYGSVDMGYGEGVVGQKYYGGRLGYKEGPLNISIGAQIAPNLAGNSKWGMGAIAGSYDFGVVKVGAFGIETKYRGRKQDAIGVNAFIPLGQGLIKLQYTNSNANSVAETAVTGYTPIGDARLMTASYAYNLSKRTQLYTTLSALKNKGAAKFVVAGAPAATAGGQNSSGFDVGVTHFF